MSHSHRIKLAGTATVGPKGQVVIPAEVRENMGIESGDKLFALYLEDKQSVVFISETEAQRFVDKMGERFAEVRTMFGEFDKHRENRR